MPRRGGRGKRGGQTREDGRRTTTIPGNILIYFTKLTIFHVF